MLPLDHAGALILPLAVMLFTERKLVLMVYYLIAITLLGFDGLAVASWYWVIFALPRMAVDMLSVRVRSTI